MPTSFVQRFKTTEAAMTRLVRQGMRSDTDKRRIGKTESRRPRWTTDERGSEVTAQCHSHVAPTAMNKSISDEQADARSLGDRSGRVGNTRRMETPQGPPATGDPALEDRELSPVSRSRVRHRLRRTSASALRGRALGATRLGGSPVRVGTGPAAGRAGLGSTGSARPGYESGLARGSITKEAAVPGAQAGSGSSTVFQDHRDLSPRPAQA